MRAISVLLLFLAGCTSTGLCIPGTPIGPDEEGGPYVEASSSGFLLADLIPIGINSRFDHAYERALKKAPGAKRLTNLRLYESWYWCGVGVLHVFTVEGRPVHAKAAGK